MAGKRRGQTNSKQVFAWLMVLSVVALLLPRRLTDGLDFVLTSLLKPVTSVSRGWGLSVTKNLALAKPGSVRVDQYRQLEERAKRQRTNLLQEIRQLKELNTALTGLRQTFGMAQASYIIAGVIGSDTSNAHRIEHLNQGVEAGVEAGQIVLGMDPRDESNQSPGESISAMFVVGRIKQAGIKGVRNTKLELLNNSGFRLPVVIVPGQNRQQDWRGQGVLEGHPMGKIVVKMVEIEGHAVQPGDIVMACSDPRRLPVEMVIGSVGDCQADRSNPLLWEIQVKPAVDLHQLGQLVIVNTKW